VYFIFSLFNGVQNYLHSFDIDTLVAYGEWITVKKENINNIVI